MLTVEFSQTHQRPYWHSPERGVFWETPTATADTAEAYGDAVDRDRARARFATLDSRPRGPGISSVFWVRGFRKCCACPETRGLRLRKLQHDPPFRRGLQGPGVRRTRLRQLLQLSLQRRQARLLRRMRRLQFLRFLLQRWTN